MGKERAGIAVVGATAWVAGGAGGASKAGGGGKAPRPPMLGAPLRTCALLASTPIS